MLLKIRRRRNFNKQNDKAVTCYECSNGADARGPDRLYSVWQRQKNITMSGHGEGTRLDQFVSEMKERENFAASNARGKNFQVSE